MTKTDLHKVCQPHLLHLRRELLSSCNKEWCHPSAIKNDNCIPDMPGSQLSSSTLVLKSVSSVTHQWYSPKSTMQYHYQFSHGKETKTSCYNHTLDQTLPDRFGFCRHSIVSKGCAGSGLDCVINHTTNEKFFGSLGEGQRQGRVATVCRVDANPMGTAIRHFQLVPIPWHPQLACFFQPQLLKAKLHASKSPFSLAKTKLCRVSIAPAERSSWNCKLQSHGTLPLMCLLALRMLIGSHS